VFLSPTFSFVTTSIRWCTLAIVLLISLGSLSAAPTAFALPAQSAARSLMVFSKQTGTNVLFPFRELEKVRANAVVGSFENDDALALLLRGTGFTALRDGEDRYVVSAERKQAAVGTISGQVVARADHAPISGALVRIVSTALRGVTDEQGIFVIADVPSGACILSIVATGYVSLRIDNVLVTEGNATQLGQVNLTLAGKDDVTLEEMVINASELVAADVFTLQKIYVSPSRFGLEEERSGLGAMLTQNDLAALPQVGEDLYRSISHLPGLTADDQTARFWVRGAPQDEVLSRLDGLDLIEPFHVKDTDGTLSIVDMQSISRLNLYTGGFTAEYGSRLAGVLEMETEDYRGVRSKTELSLSYTGARVANKGGTRDGRIRWLSTARLGLIEHILKDEAGAGDAQIRPSYYDLGGKIEYDLTPKQTLSFHYLHAHDRMSVTNEGDPDLKSRYSSSYLWGRWQAELSDHLKSEAVLAYSHLSAAREGSGKVAEAFPVDWADDRTLDQWSLRQGLTYGFSERLLLLGGWEAAHGTTDYHYRLAEVRPLVANGVFTTPTFRRTVELDPSGSQGAAYLSARFQPLDPLTLETGLRYQVNNYADDHDLSPRASAAWNFGKTTLRAAWGYYDQAQGLQNLSVGDNERTFQHSERAEHRILGIEHRFRPGLNLRVEAYERQVRNPFVRWENVYGGFNTVPEIEGDRVRFNSLRGRSRGVEVVAEQRIGDRYSWTASYTRSRAEETLSTGQTVPRRRDQRDALYLDFTYRPNRKWLFSAAWQYHTGWPVTERQFTQLTLADGSKVWFSSPGPLYQLRLPAYQRLDLRAQRLFHFRSSDLRVYADLFNALGKRNLISYHYRVEKQSDGTERVVRVSGDKLFPLLPGFGANWEF